MLKNERLQTAVNVIKCFPMSANFVATAYTKSRSDENGDTNTVSSNSTALSFVSVLSGERIASHPSSSTVDSSSTQHHEVVACCTRLSSPPQVIKPSRSPHVKPEEAESGYPNTLKSSLAFSPASSPATASTLSLWGSIVNPIKKLWEVPTIYLSTFYGLPNQAGRPVSINRGWS